VPRELPTTVTLDSASRVALLDFARRERVAILEDDHDQEFHYDRRPVLLLASADPHGSMICVGTLAKIVAPRLRLAFLVAPEPLLARIDHERLLLDRQGDPMLECAVERPAGGLALWARVGKGVDVEDWRDRAQRLGAYFQIGRQFSLEARSVPCVRFGFALLDEHEITKVIRRLRESLPSLSRR